MHIDFWVHLGKPLWDSNFSFSRFCSRHRDQLYRDLVRTARSCSFWRLLSHLLSKGVVLPPVRDPNPASLPVFCCPTHSERIYRSAHPYTHQFRTRYWSNSECVFMGFPVCGQATTCHIVFTRPVRSPDTGHLLLELALILLQGCCFLTFICHKHHWL